jgi:hypothetical protein
VFWFIYAVYPKSDPGKVPGKPPMGPYEQLLGIDQNWSYDEALRKMDTMKKNKTGSAQYELTQDPDNIIFN